MLLAALSGCLLAAAPGASARAPRSVRLGVLPAVPAGTRPVAPLDPARTLHLTVVLRPRRPAALAAFAAAVSDPASPHFRRYITPAQFARRFGPSSAQIAAVAAALRRHGLRPGPASANRLAIPVVAGAGSIERAFAVSLEKVRLPGGRIAVLSGAAPAVDPAVAGVVQAVIGLNGLDRPVAAVQPAARSGVVPRLVSAGRPQASTGGPRACGAARSQARANSAYTASQFASSYRFSTLYRRGDRGGSVTVAIYELEPNARSDIAAYQACYHTQAAVSYVKVDGGAGSGNGQGEAALDIEQVIGLAPRAHLLVYQGPNSNSAGPGSGPYDVYNKIVSQDRAAVVSTSWGVCEPNLGRSAAAAENTLFQEAAAQGQTVVSASGDSGSEGCYGQLGFDVPNKLAVVDPASQPMVTGVGGTTLRRLGPPPAETTWNNGGSTSPIPSEQPGASGGGISSLWRMPVYQRQAPSSLRTIQPDSSGSPCGATGGYCREVPDVSADADPNSGYLIYFNGNGADPLYQSGWQGIGGTSGAAPLWAALVALADANRSCRGERLGFVNPVLYRVAAAGLSGYFNDVGTGNNDDTGMGGGLYAAGTGYDMATGLGTPKGYALALALCGQGLRLGYPGRQTGRLGRSVSLRLHVSDAPGAGLALSARGLPPGLSLSGERIAGRPSRVGTYHATVRAADADGARRTVHFSWVVRRA